METTESSNTTPDQNSIPVVAPISEHQPPVRRITLPLVVVGLVILGIGTGLVVGFVSRFGFTKLAVVPSQVTPTVVVQPTSEVGVSPTASVAQALEVVPTRLTTMAPTPTKKPTSSLVTATPSPAATQSSCAYGSGATGAVKVEIKPQSGLVVGDQTVELQALTGCKVLDGSSSDKQTMVARAGGNGYASMNTVTYSSVPSGSYSVRIQYKGQWTGYQNVTVVAGQSKTVEFQVNGETPTSTPTPTSIPKPVCGLVVPNSSGSAPFAATLCVSNNSSPYQAIQQELVDYNGDGLWDYQGPTYGCHGYTFTAAGSYTPRAKIVNTNGVESDVCQAAVTVN